MKTTDGRLFFLVLDAVPIQKLEMQFIPPEIILNRQPAVDGIQIVGSNVPGYQYVGGETTVTLMLDWFSEQENRRDVMYKTKWIESLAYIEGVTERKQRIKLVFGDMFRDEVWIIKGVTTRYSLFNKQYGWLPQQAYQEVVLGLDSDMKASQVMFDDSIRLYASDESTIRRTVIL